MRQIFVDTLYWIAITNRRDQWHQTAMKASLSLVGCYFVTTEEVLTEYLTAFCGNGPVLRQRAVVYTRGLYNNRNVIIFPQSNLTFLAGLSLYEARADKEYSLPDCISMATMRREGITEILTNDDHFSQEGFIKLLRP